MVTLGDKDYIQDAGVPLELETHSGEDVAIYAQGPMAHLIHATHEQSYVGHVLMYAACVGPYSGARCHHQRPEPATRKSGSTVNRQGAALLTLPLAVLMAATRLLGG